MPSKRIILITGLTLLIAAGVYTAWRVFADPSEQSNGAAKHSTADGDSHEHSDHGDDHSEQGDHPHGDEDEHSHGDDHIHDHGASEKSHEENQKPSEGEDHEEGSQIDKQVADDLNINVEAARPVTIRKILPANGRIILDPKSTAQVKGRFPGVIRSVSLQPGQEVKAGTSLVSIESNESLQVYSVPSPISGTIISRNANIGETSGEEPLFVVANLDTLVVELFIFAGDSARVLPGQKVRIQSLDSSSTSDASINVVLPTTEASSQTLVARADLNNPDGQWRSGVNIRAEITVAEEDVPVAVKTDAIQRVDGKPVVFVQTAGGKFMQKSVVLGLADSEWTEIKSGIQDGQEYVATNSFIVKSDIGKAGADHAH